MVYENRVAIISAISRMDIPIDRGLIIKNMFSASDVIARINVVNIYIGGSCTHSTSTKGLCALYTTI
jgi:hypothetical protein